MNKSYADVTPHGQLQLVFNDVWTVTGSVEMAPGLRISRNMTVIRQNGQLTLVNPVRLDEPTLDVLSGLGEVTHLVNLGAYHLGNKNGLDIDFYLDRFDTQLWFLPQDPRMQPSENSSVDAQRVQVLTSDNLPITNAQLFTFQSVKLPEAILILTQDDGIAISADCLQNWKQADEFFNDTGAKMMAQAGFIKAANVGPEWRRFNQPDADELLQVLQLPFQHVLPSHGSPVLFDAKGQYQKTLTKLLAA